MDEPDHEQGDPTEAFEKLRAEVALMRRAVEGIAAERAHVDVPDYTETLGQLQRDMNVAGENIARIGQFLKLAPALAMTPEQTAQRIAAAGSAARREDQAALATARKGLEDVTRQLHGLLVSVRTTGEQNRSLAWVAIGGIALGIALWATLAGVVARAAPVSWRWPERMAARTLRLTPWEAGQRMMRTENPAQFRAIVAADRIVTANNDAIERCRKAAARADEPVKCTVRIEPAR